jgi:3alpha(or 20beta)-hydroxysteroid dehydrogenase
MLEGKVCVITGAARGQGAAEAKLFHEHGARLILTDRDPAGRDVAEALGDEVVFLHHDVTDRNGWLEVSAHARKAFGRVDVLVNNAGVTGYDTVQEIDPASLQRYLDIHCFGPLLGIQILSPMMPRGGAIVNVASTAALRGYPSFLGYGVSKWALRGLTRYAAHDLVGQGIRINTILPGPIDTPMMHEPGGDEIIAASIAAVPMQRMGTASEVAHAALFLASAGSSYMTGTDIVVDGGLNA